MTTLRKALSQIGLLIAIAPVIWILIDALTSQIGDDSGWLSFIIFYFTIIPAILGLIMYLIADKKIKRKLIVLLSVIVIYFTVFPITTAINNYKSKLFITEHQSELEKIATALINANISEADANLSLEEKGINLRIICHENNSKYVLFLVDGILDNCYGFAFTKEKNKPDNNCSGLLTSWEEIMPHWFIWTTT